MKALRLKDTGPSLDRKDILGLNSKIVKYLEVGEMWRNRQRRQRLTARRCRFCLDPMVVYRYHFYLWHMSCLLTSKGEL